MLFLSLFATKALADPSSAKALTDPSSVVINGVPYVKAVADPSSGVTVVIKSYGDDSTCSTSTGSPTTLGPTNWGSSYDGDCTTDLVQDNMFSNGNSVRSDYEDVGMSQWGVCFKNTNTDAYQSVSCTDTAGHKNPKKDLGKCQPCVANPTSTDTSTDCSKIITQTLCEIPEDSQNAHSCYWYGDENGHYGPGCSDYESNCSPCVIGNWDNTDQADAICNPLKNLADCNDAIGTDGNSCMWMGWGMGRNCNAISPIVAEWYKAVWLIVVLIIVVFTCVICLSIYCCCAASFGAAFCCVKTADAAMGNNNQRGRVNNQAYARMGGTNGGLA